MIDLNSKINLLLKWVVFIVIVGSLPVICRIAIYYFPHKKIDHFEMFSLTDLLFYGISLHASAIYELFSKKQDCLLNTFAILTSTLFLLTYLFYSGVSMLEPTDLNSFPIIGTLIIVSIAISIGSYIYTIWGNNNG